MSSLPNPMIYVFPLKIVRLIVRLNHMTVLLPGFLLPSMLKEMLFLGFFLCSSPSWSQTVIQSKLQFTENAPADLLANRSVVLHSYNFQRNELEEIQKAFQQIGIDAVAYFETDVVLAGKDVTNAFTDYFNSRQIKYLIFFEKSPNGFQFVATTFNLKADLVNNGQAAWRVNNQRLNELLRTVFQDSWRTQKKQNYLINESPESDISIDPFTGGRQEFFAIDLKVDLLAVPKFGDESMDKELEQFFVANYPLKYKITEPGTDEKLLRSQGFLYVLCFVRTRGQAAREILGYDMTKAESAYASVTFPSGQLQLKTIPAGTEVYKFYVRHIGNGNVYFGNKWDADLTWQDALRNYIFGFKAEAKIN
jgi:hypothetical protein